MYNPAATAVNLAGYYLTDKPDQADRVADPLRRTAGGARLPGRSSADGTNQTNPAELHTNFSLCGSGGYVALVAPDGATVALLLHLPQQQGDSSYGIAMAQATTRTGRLITSYGAVGYLTPRPAPSTAASLAHGIAAAARRSTTPTAFTARPFQLCHQRRHARRARSTTRSTARCPQPTNGTLYTGADHDQRRDRTSAPSPSRPATCPACSTRHSFIYTGQVVDPGRQRPAAAGLAVELGAERRALRHGPAGGRTTPRTAARSSRTCSAMPTFSITMNLADLFDPTTGIYSNSDQAAPPGPGPPRSSTSIPTAPPGFTANVGLAIHGGASALSAPSQARLPRQVRQRVRAEGVGLSRCSALRRAPAFKEFDLRTDQNNSWQYPSHLQQLHRPSATSSPTPASGRLGQAGRAHVDLLPLHQRPILGPVRRHGPARRRLRRQLLRRQRRRLRRASSPAATTTAGPSKPPTATSTPGPACTTTSAIAAALRATTPTTSMIQGNNPDGTPNPAYPTLLDIDNLIQYMMMIYYTGNLDAPNSNFLGNDNPNNFYAIRPTDGRLRLPLHRHRLGVDAAGRQRPTASTPRHDAHATHRQPRRTSSSNWRPAPSSSSMWPTTSRKSSSTTARCRVHATTGPVRTRWPPRPRAASSPNRRAGATYQRPG